MRSEFVPDKMSELEYLKMIYLTERNYDPVAINIWHKIKMD